MSNITCRYLKSLPFETHKLLQIFFQWLLHKMLDITYSSGFKTSTFFSFSVGAEPALQKGCKLATSLNTSGNTLSVLDLYS